MLAAAVGWTARIGWERVHRAPRKLSGHKRKLPFRDPRLHRAWHAAISVAWGGQGTGHGLQCILQRSLGRRTTYRAQRAVCKGACGGVQHTGHSVQSAKGHVVAYNIQGTACSLQRGMWWRTTYRAQACSLQRGMWWHTAYRAQRAVCKGACGGVQHTGHSVQSAKGHVVAYNIQGTSMHSAQQPGLVNIQGTDMQSARGSGVARIPKKASIL